MVTAIKWARDAVVILDQRALPAREEYLSCATQNEVADAIRNMAVRGAPAIGIAAAMGIALGIMKSDAATVGELDQEFRDMCSLMAGTRPTAVNLFWAIERMRSVYLESRHLSIEAVREILTTEALLTQTDDVQANLEIGRHGNPLLPEKACVLTHCNTGSLATGGYGTALGVIRTAVKAGKQIRVYATETRPFLQGARLTAWELQKEGIPVRVIADSMAGFYLQHGKVDCVIVGADRIAANGDTANKIGTYTLAVLAKENGVPFYVAAPRTTLDQSLPDGQSIPIEMRDPEEVRRFQGIEIVPPGVEAENPAFDVTPNRYITAIVTDRGLVRPPYAANLAKLSLKPADV